MHSLPKLAAESIYNTGSSNIKEAAKFLIGKEEFYPHLSKAYRLALTIPVSVANNERSFSKLKIVKNYLRTTMKENRLDSLMIACCSHEILDLLDINKLADEWSVLKTRRVSI